MSKSITRITGKDLMKRWDMDGYQILQYMEKRELKISGGTFDDKVTVEKLLIADKTPYDLDDTIGSFQFALSDVEAIENKHNLLSGKRDTVDQNIVFPCKPGTKWEDVKIALVENDTVRIETPQGKGRYTWSDLKMVDGRIRNRPTMLWGLFKLLAKNEGRISSGNIKYNPQLPDTAKRLNRHLKQLFKINDSIYKYHYKKHKAYITKIKFNDKTEKQEETFSDETNNKKSNFDNEVEDISSQLNLPDKSYL